MIKPKQETIKEKILFSALKLVPEMGWNIRCLEKACINAGYDKKLGEVIFTKGVEGIIEYFISSNDQQMLDELKHIDLLKMRIRDRIFTAIKLKLNIYSPNKLVVARTLSYLSIPFNSMTGLKLLWQTADLIWYEAGLDKSTDFNYYTKRMLLSLVYSSTIIFWLNDDSMEAIDTLHFLERRIDNVMSIGKFLNKR